MGADQEGPQKGARGAVVNLCKAARAVEGWFEREARELPWRTTPRDPYRSLVSEFMLQQTQVSRVLEKFGVRVLGTPVETIEDTEDRDRFTARLDEIDVKTPESQAVTNTEEAVRVAEGLGYPVMLRIAYALGGLGSGLCRDERDLRERAEKAFAHTDQILNQAGYDAGQVRQLRDDGVVF